MTHRTQLGPRPVPAPRRPPRPPLPRPPRPRPRAARRQPGRPPRIADLGCGPGNVTVLLSDRWPDAHVTGLDNSAEMLAEAQPARGPHHRRRPPRLRATPTRRAGRPTSRYDLIVSNAALQWVPGHPDAFPAWLAALRPGGTLAFQVPGNFDAPSHALLRDLCDAPAWRDRLGRRASATPAPSWTRRLPGPPRRASAARSTPGRPPTCRS